VTVRIGTRASKLALTQTQQTADQLAAVGGFPVELVRGMSLATFAARRQAALRFRETV
jgi:porphobilinogen deaminase